MVTCAGSISYAAPGNDLTHNFSNLPQGAMCTENFTIQPDIRVFTLYAFLNGAVDCYDSTSDRYTTLQKKLREDIRLRLVKVPPKTRSLWIKYYQQHPAHTWAYLYYMLHLDPSPKFVKIAKKKDIEHLYIIKYLDKFRQVMKEFYNSCGIEELYYETYKQSFIDEIAKYKSDWIDEDIHLMYRYLRIDRTAKSIDLRIVPLPFETKYSSYAIRFGTVLYILDGPGTTDYGLNVHEYLHLFVDPMIQNTIKGFELNFGPICEENKTKQYVSGNYEELQAFVAECLVRALDHRIELVRKKNRCTPDEYERVKRNINKTNQAESDNGLALIPYFYEKLNDYESKRDVDITTYVRQTLAEYKPIVSNQNQ